MSCFSVLGRHKSLHARDGADCKAIFVCLCDGHRSKKLILKHNLKCLPSTSSLKHRHQVEARVVGCLFATEFWVISPTLPPGCHANPSPWPKRVCQSFFVWLCIPLTEKMHGTGKM